MAARCLALALGALAACGGPGPPPGTTGPGGGTGDPAAPDAVATELLRAHDDVRAGAQPPPSPPLPPLVWSPDVAAIAQAWADGCHYAHDAGRGALGENIAAGTAGYLTPAGVVRLWASEAPFYDLASNTCDTSAANEAGTCGHYTQLVWRDTLRVGCGHATCTTGSPFGSGSWDFWVCDYDPPGNWVGERPY